MFKGQSRTRVGAAALRPKPKLDGDALRHRPCHGGEVNPETEPCLIHTYRHYRTVECNTKQYEYLEIRIPSQTNLVRLRLKHTTAEIGSAGFKD